MKTDNSSRVKKSRLLCFNGICWIGWFGSPIPLSKDLYSLGKTFGGKRGGLY